MSDEEHVEGPMLPPIAEGVSTDEDRVAVAAASAPSSSSDELRVRTVELWPDGRLMVRLRADVSSARELILKVPKHDVHNVLCTLDVRDDRGNDPPPHIIYPGFVRRPATPPSPGGGPHHGAHPHHPHHHHHHHHPNYGVVDDDDDDVGIDVDDGQVHVVDALLHNGHDIAESLYDTSVTGSEGYGSNGSRNHVDGRAAQRYSHPPAELIVSPWCEGKGVISAGYSIRRPSAAYEIGYRARVPKDSTADWRASAAPMQVSACVRNATDIPLRRSEIILRSGCVHPSRRSSRSNRRTRSFSRRAPSPGPGSGAPYNPDAPDAISGDAGLGLYLAEIDAENYQRGSILATIKSVDLVAGGTAVLSLPDARVAVGVIHRYRPNAVTASRVVVMRNEGDSALQAGCGLIVFDDSRRALPFEIPTLAPGDEAYSELTQTSGVAVRMSKAERGGQIVRTRLVGDILTTWTASVRTLYFTIRNHEQGYVELYLAFRCSGDDITAGTSSFSARALRNEGEEEDIQVPVITPSHGAIRERCGIVHLQGGEQRDVEIEESYLKSDSFNVKAATTTRIVEELSRAGIDSAVIDELRNMVRLIRLHSSLRIILAELTTERAFARRSQSSSGPSGVRNGTGHASNFSGHGGLSRGASPIDGVTSTSAADSRADWGDGSIHWTDRGRRLIAKLEQEERVKNLDEELDRLDVRIVDIEAEMQDTRDKIWRLLR